MPDRVGLLRRGLWVLPAIRDAEDLPWVNACRVRKPVGLGQDRHRSVIPPGDGPEGVSTPDRVGLLRRGLWVSPVLLHKDRSGKMVQVHTPPNARHLAVIGILKARPAGPVAAGDVGL